MRLSHSRVECFKSCPYKYKLRYLDKLEALPDYDPTSPLILGSAMHKGIETTKEEALAMYFASYPIIDDAHVTEAIKLEYWFKVIKESIPMGGEHEIEIGDDNFVGYIDYLVEVGSDSNYTYYDLYDWKYSNNINGYLDSDQLHLYKYYYELANPTKKIRNMYFVFIPKCNLRIKYKNKTNKRDETLYEYRKRILEDLESKELQFVRIDYNTEMVIRFLREGIEVLNAASFPKSPSRLCDWCEFKRYCESEGKDDVDMQLPKNERVTSNTKTKRKIWFYGAPFSGKTYLANSFPDMLLLSTDGNYRQLPGGIPPHVDIKDNVVVEGRVTKKTFAWEVFKDVISELEKNQNDFKTIVLDLLEDTYEYCRLYMYDQLGISHESDDSFRAWDKVRTEYLSTIKRLMNLDYENIILISHEDTSKDITKKTGDKITSIKPNLQDKASLKIAGMVDLVARVVADDNNRYVSFKSNEVVFGGGRLGVTESEVPCAYEAILKVYEDANGGLETAVNTPKVATPEETVRNRRSRD